MSNLVKKSDYNINISEIDSKTQCINGLVATALTAVENKIPSFSNLVKKSRL